MASQTLTGIIGYLRQGKELLVVAGVVGPVVAHFAKIQSKYAIAVGVLGFLFILIWGLFERSNGATVLKTLAWLGIVVASLGICCLGVVAFVLLMRDSSYAGSIILKDEGGFVLVSDRQTDRLMGSYDLEIKRSASLVEIGIIPAPEDLGQVQDVDMTTAGLPAQTDRVTLLANKTSEIQTYYRITDPSPEFALTLHSIVTLKRSSSQPIVRMRVFYTYIERDMLWEMRQWVSKNLGW